MNACRVPLEVVPANLTLVRRFVGEHHRHNLPPEGWLWGCAAGGVPNGNSMIYGALARAAKALGYRRAITYTLAHESGASLRAAGWTIDAELAASAGWDQPGRARVEVDLFGEARTPDGPKVRWRKALTAGTKPRRV